MAGGIRKYTVQEAGNVGLGQAGSFFIDDNTDTTVTQGVIVAITVIGAAQGFAKLIPEEGFTCFGTAVASSAGGTVIAAANELPVGTTIHGRWTQVQIAANPNGGIICYLGG